MENFCKYCKSPLNGSSKFCIRCGAYIQPDQPTTQDNISDNPQPVYPPYRVQQPVAYNPGFSYVPQPEKKSGKKKWVIGGIIAGVVLIAAAVCLIIFLMTPKFQTSEYLLSSMTDDDGGDYILTLLQSDKNIPKSLFITGEGTAEIKDTKGELYAKLTFDKDKQSGTVQYVGGKDENNVRVSSEKNSMIFYDSALGFKMEYILKSKSVTDNLSGEYTITDLRFGNYTRYGEYFAYCTEASFFNPTHLTIDSGGKGSFTIATGEESVSMELDPRSMTGTCQYLKNEGGGEVIACPGEDTLNFYFTFDDSAYYFRRSDTINFASLKGKYELKSIAVGDNKFDTLSDYTDFTTKNVAATICSLNLNTDGSGSIDFLNDDSYCQFSVDTSKMTGDANYTSADKQGYIFMTDDGDAVTVYDYSGNSTMTFQRPADNDLSAIAGEYALTDVVSFGGVSVDDFVYAFAEEKKKMPVKMSLSEDGSGQIMYINGDSYCDITVPNAGVICSGYHIVGNQTLDLIIDISGDKVTLFNNRNAGKLIFKRVDTIDLSKLEGDYRLTSIYSARYPDTNDYKDYAKKENMFLPSSMTVDRSGKCELKNSNNSKSATIDIDNNMSCKLVTTAGKSIDAMVIDKGGEIIIYSDGIVLHLTRT